MKNKHRTWFLANLGSFWHSSYITHALKVWQWIDIFDKSMFVLIPCFHHLQKYLEHRTWTPSNCWANHQNLQFNNSQPSTGLHLKKVMKQSLPDRKFIPTVTLFSLWNKTICVLPGDAAPADLEYLCDTDHRIFTACHVVQKGNVFSHVCQSACSGDGPMWPSHNPLGQYYISSFIKPDPSFNVWRAKR